MSIEVRKCAESLSEREIHAVVEYRTALRRLEALPKTLDTNVLTHNAYVVAKAELDAAYKDEQAARHELCRALTGRR